MHYDYLIAGAGLFGAVFAHEMHKQGRKVLVVEKRDHIAGNIYTGKGYGHQRTSVWCPYFHTSDEEVWNYVKPVCPVQPLCQFSGCSLSG